MRFISRVAAGRELAAALRPFAKSGPILFALPRGGIVVAAEVARSLRAPLDLILVRKLGHPFNQELAAGALAEGGKPVYDNAGATLLDDEWRDRAEQNARTVLAHRRQVYFAHDFVHPIARDRPALIIDDGMATGLTMLAAVRSLRKYNPQYITAAIPVASRPSIDLLKDYADECIVLDDPDMFQGSVAMHYADFPQVDDNTVKSLLERSKNHEIQQTTSIHPKA
jgi:putative phosphoribosyl transferase